MLFKQSLTILLASALAGIGKAGPIQAPYELNGVASGAVEKRTDYTITEHCIGIANSDSVYTYGLATCPGIAATGDRPSEVVIDKVLCHIRCADAAAQIQEYKDMMTTLGLQNVQVAVSVVDPQLVDPELREAQEALNNEAINAALESVGGDDSRVRIETRDNLDQPEPSGSMRITVERQIEAEGEVIWEARGMSRM